MSVLPVISLGLALGAMTSVVWWQSGLHADRLERRPLARDEVFIHARVVLTPKSQVRFPGLMVMLKRRSSLKASGA